MKTLIKLEELALVLLSFYLFLALDYSWWWFPLLFFFPDISMIGFLISKNAGATTYNVIHHKALSVALYLLGSFTQMPAFQLIGLVMFGHSSLDRALGFELQQTENAIHEKDCYAGRGRCGSPLHRNRHSRRIASNRLQPYLHGDQ